MIREYSLDKYRHIECDNIPPKRIDVSKLDAWELMLHNFETSLWEQFSETTADRINRLNYEKHPSTYRNGVKGIIK